jgi:nucleoside-specific outer membrane channel protein Tsx
MFSPKSTLAGLVLMSTVVGAHAAEWSDTSISWRYGKDFAEPYVGSGISKNIIGFTHSSGYKYGTNYLNLDLLMANDKDPLGTNSSSGSQEAYLVYRHTLDIGKVIVKPDALKFGPVRGLGLTGGFDWNSKNDAGYNSRKRMLVAGPTVMFDVPGFLNASVLQLWESNAPYNKYTSTQTERYSYDPHPMLSLAWGIPFNVGPVPLSFEGFANYIAAKGKNEFGGATRPETDIDMQIMYDLGKPLGAGANTFKVGLEYQYWHNKFGNYNETDPAKGSTARTPMVRAEYHF